MPGLDLGELVELSDDLIRLLGDVAAATRKASDGGRKITRAEGLALARAGSDFVSKLLAEIAD